MGATASLAAEDAGRAASTAARETTLPVTAPILRTRMLTGPAVPLPGGASGADSLGTLLPIARPRTSCASTVDREATFPATAPRPRLNLGRKAKLLQMQVESVLCVFFERLRVSSSLLPLR